jgi:hypothetical protein
MTFGTLMRSFRASVLVNERLLAAAFVEHRSATVGEDESATLDADGMNRLSPIERARFGRRQQIGGVGIGERVEWRLMRLRRRTRNEMGIMVTE